MTLVAPNAAEASAASGVASKDADSLEEAGAALLARLDCRYVVITLGERGMAWFIGLMVVVLPVLLLGGAMLTWIDRR